MKRFSISLSTRWTLWISGCYSSSSIIIFYPVIFSFSFSFPFHIFPSTILASVLFYFPVDLIFPFLFLKFKACICFWCMIKMLWKFCILSFKIPINACKSESLVSKCLCSCDGNSRNYWTLYVKPSFPGSNLS